MANKVLEVHLKYTEGNIKYSVAVQSETNPDNFNAFRGQAPDLSNYKIGRIIEEGKQLTKEEALNDFPFINRTFELK